MIEEKRDTDGLIATTVFYRLQVNYTDSNNVHTYYLYTTQKPEQENTKNFCVVISGKKFYVNTVGNMEKISGEWKVTNPSPEEFCFRLKLVKSWRGYKIWKDINTGQHTITKTENKIDLLAIIERYKAQGENLWEFEQQTPDEINNIYFNNVLNQN